MTVGEAIRQGSERLANAGVDTPRLDTQLLLAFALGCRREDLAREPEMAIGDVDEAAFLEFLDRRARREPLPYIIGAQHFYGREFHVDSAVLIPRPETELLVKSTLDRLVNVDVPRIADVGAGSGCVGITIAAERPDARVWATDISPEALAVAARNAASIGVEDRISFLQGDLLEPVAIGNPGLHAIVSNPPYVTEAELVDLQSEVRDYEPRLALSGVDGASGEAGIALYPRLFAEAYVRLVPGGWVLVEIGAGQSDAVVQTAIDAGFVDVDAAFDIASIPRVVSGRKR